MVSTLQGYYNDIWASGMKGSPRGMPTRGLFDQSFWFTPGEVFIRPRSNINIGFVELLQFISGTFSVKPFSIVAPKARLDLFTGQSAYGPRVASQLQRVIDELRKDRETRRAVLMIAHPTDTPETLPCTLSMQFQLLKQNDVSHLFTVVTMRSSDLVWGIPTDIIQFGGMCQMIANCVGAVAHECVINAGNAHIYEETQLSINEEYRLAGMFSLPEFYTLEEYQAWANKGLAAIEDRTPPRELFKYEKFQVERVQSF